MNKINPLVVVMSCNKNRDLWKDILQCSSNCIIFTGNPDLDTEYKLVDRVLYLKCEDTYDHLPTKVYRMICSILDMEIFFKYTHIFKIDDHDTQFNDQTITNIKNIIYKLKKIGRMTDYLAQQINFLQKRTKFLHKSTYHFGKCPKTSYWYQREYNGYATSWCDGGCGYILSKRAMDTIRNRIHIDTIYKTHIYEDVMIALLLKKGHIVPTKIPPIIKTHVPSNYTSFI